MPTRDRVELLQGTLDLLILRVLRQERMHGWGIAQQIQQISRDVLQVNQGSLYPALHRLEARGWLRSRWGTSANNRQAKFYTLTRKGRTQLALATARWQRYATALSSALAAPAPTSSRSGR